MLLALINLSVVVEPSIFQLIEPVPTEIVPPLLIAPEVVREAILKLFDQIGADVTPWAVKI